MHSWRIAMDSYNMHCHRVINTEARCQRRRMRITKQTAVSQLGGWTIQPGLFSSFFSVDTFLSHRTVDLPLCGSEINTQTTVLDCSSEWFTDRCVQNDHRDCISPSYNLHFTHYRVLHVGFKYNYNKLLTVFRKKSYINLLTFCYCDPSVVIDTIKNIIFSWKYWSKTHFLGIIF